MGGDEDVALLERVLGDELVPLGPGPREVLPLRALGSGVTHLASFKPDDTLELTHMGSAFRGVLTPVAMLCYAVIHPPKAWMENGRLCLTCRRTAEAKDIQIRWLDRARDL